MSDHKGNGYAKRPLLVNLTLMVPLPFVQEFRLSHRILVDNGLTTPSFEDFVQFCFLVGAKRVIQQGQQVIHNRKHAPCGHPWEAIHFEEPPREPSETEPEGFGGRGYCVVCRDQAENSQSPPDGPSSPGPA